MKQLPSPLARACIRIAYLLPALFGLVMLILAFVPRVFFFYNGEVYDTQSTFALMGNTWRESQTMLDASSQGSGGAYFFSLIMSVLVVLSWISIIVYASMAIASAICSTAAFSAAPTDRFSNRSKRWMHFFCPNRVLYVISNLLLLLPAAFPYFLQHFYRTQLGYDMKPFFIGPSDLLLAGIFVILNLASFLALLPAQARERMDMYRLYKSKKEIGHA